MRQRKVCEHGHVFYKTPTATAARNARPPGGPPTDSWRGWRARRDAHSKGAGLTTLAKLSKKSEAQLRELHGMGPNALGKLRASLAKEGLSFRT